MISNFTDTYLVQAGAELAYAVPFLSVAVLAGTAAYVAVARNDLEKAEGLADQRRIATEQAEAARLRLVNEMEVLQDKDTKLVSRVSWVSGLYG